MPVDRYFVEGNYQPFEELLIEGNEFHHLHHVLRSREGDFIEIFNGKGFLGKGHLIHLDKKKAIIKLEKVFQEPSPKNELILAQALPRMNKLDWILEKGTELGVTEFWLFPGKRSEKKCQTVDQIEKLKHHLVAAAKQSGRLHLPIIHMMPALSKWNFTPDRLSFFGDIEESALPLFHYVNAIQEHSKILFCVGPESGFHPEEIELLQKQGFLGVRLNPFILRTETAALSAVAILAHLKFY